MTMVFLYTKVDIYDRKDGRVIASSGGGAQVGWGAMVCLAELIELISARGLFGAGQQTVVNAEPLSVRHVWIRKGAGWLVSRRSGRCGWARGRQPPADGAVDGDEQVKRRDSP